MRHKKPSDEYLVELGHRLKIIRTYLRLDQKKMSGEMKTAQSQMSKIESGQSAPTLHQLRTIKKLANGDKFLRENLTWEWIIEGKGKGIIS